VQLNQPTNNQTNNTSMSCSSEHRSQD